MKLSASRTASSMCRSRIASFSFILESGGVYNPIPKVAAEVARGPQIDVASEFLGELLLHADYVEQSGHFLGVELHEDIDVAFGRES